MSTLPSTALSDVPREEVSDGTDPMADMGLHQLGGLAEQTGIAIVDLSGFLDHIDAGAQQQLTVVDQVADQAKTLTQINQEMTNGLGTVAAANARAMATVDGSLDMIKTSTEKSRDVAGWVGKLDETLASVEQTLKDVSRANQRIAEIAKQVNILAVNARIEAARAGDMGRGFAVVAEAINALSKETSDAALDVTGSTTTLRSLIGGLRTDASDVSSGAETVLQSATATDDALNRISTDVRTASQDTERLTTSADAVSTAVERLGPAVETLNSGLHATASGLDKAKRRAEDIIDISEQAVQVSVQMGATSGDSHIIDLVRENAATISALFESAVDAGSITTTALFNTQYKDIQGTNPRQVMAPFTAFTDAVLPPVLEALQQADERIVFCAAVDVNGYLPTHNANFSRPQSNDPVWNAAHCRNRRIFNDRVGLKSGQSTAPFLMQTYRRDMGGGQFVLMKDISAPITVQGRHWGGLRMGVKPLG